MGSNNKADIAVEKTWSGVHKDEAYPSIELYLYRSETKLTSESAVIEAYEDTVRVKNTEAYQKLTLSSGTAGSDNPTVTGVFRNLLVYQPNGEKYHYYIIEHNFHDQVYEADKNDALSDDNAAYCVKEIQLKKDLTDTSQSATQNHVAFINTYIPMNTAKMFVSPWTVRQMQTMASSHWKAAHGLRHGKIFRSRTVREMRISMQL